MREPFIKAAKRSAAAGALTFLMLLPNASFAEPGEEAVWREGYFLDLGAASGANVDSFSMGYFGYTGTEYLKIETFATTNDDLGDSYGFGGAWGVQRRVGTVLPYAGAVVAGGASDRDPADLRYFFHVTFEGGAEDGVRREAWS